MRHRDNPGDRQTRVFIVDDHPIVRQGLTRLINQEPDLLVCGEAEDAPRALAAIQALQPDLALVDISLQGTSGIELVRCIKARFPRVSTLVVSMHNETFYAERALRAGAMGYVMKREPPEKVVEAIRTVRRGGVYLSDRTAAVNLNTNPQSSPGVRSSPVDRLTNREFEVFQLIGQGMGTRQVAQRLQLSVKTIESHCANIKDKLKLASGTQLMAEAIRWVQSPQVD